MSAEQREAVLVLTGRGGMAVLVGQAGTGKGVVIRAAREAWERDGQRVIGTAVAGATAKRLGADAQIGHTVTADALILRHAGGELVLDGRTVVVMDEAAMADTRRLAALTDATARSGSKLVLVGDCAQLSPLGAGGLFERVRREAPSAQPTEVHRVREDWERRAWGQLRGGQPDRALAEYRARGRLHVDGTRDEAAERMVADWDRARRGRPPGRVLMLTDASNVELDRINALAQQRRAQAGELGQRRVPVPGRPYGLGAGDRVMLTGQLRVPGAERVENGITGEVLAVEPREQRVRLRTAESPPRELDFSTGEFADVRLAYAQHVYKAQGATVDRALVLTGGWQTDRERSYVAFTRARERTDVYVSREDLGEAGLDAGAIARLGERMAVSRSQQASITQPQRNARPDVERSPAGERLGGDIAPRADAAIEQQEGVITRPVGGDDVRESRVGRILREQREAERERARDEGLGLG